MAHHIGLSYLEYSEDVFNLFFKQGKRVFKAVKKKKMLSAAKLNWMNQQHTFKRWG